MFEVLMLFITRTPVRHLVRAAVAAPTFPGFATLARLVKVVAKRSFVAQASIDLAEVTGTLHVDRLLLGTRGILSLLVTFGS